MFNVNWIVFVGHPDFADFDGDGMLDSVDPDDDNDGVDDVDDAFQFNAAALSSRSDTVLFIYRSYSFG